MEQIKIALIDSNSIKYSGEYVETLELHPAYLLLYGWSETTEYDETLGINRSKKYDFAKVVYKKHITNILLGWDNTNEFYSLRVYQYDNEAEMEFCFHDRAAGHNVLSRIMAWMGVNEPC